MKSDTIGAVSTPPGSGGIGIIRVSGDDAVTFVDGIFASRRRNTEDYSIRAAGEVVRMSSYTLKHGYIFDPDTDTGDGTPEFVDECLVSVMLAPKSYTGENVVEINSHGGSAVLRRVLGILYRQGVRPAEPGEFTKRAFLNGKVDLSQAEAVSDLIKARTEESRKAAFGQLSGRLAREIGGYSRMLKETLAQIEVAIDYPEYDEDDKICADAIESLKATVKGLKKLSESYARGRILKEGLRVTICGRPNAGKSSLLNGLLGTERAIVTDIAGTTRDTIEECLDVRGYTVILTDTAGLRNADDPIEKIGVDRAYSELDAADLVIYLCDGTALPEEEAEFIAEIGEKLAAKPVIFAVNKLDLMSHTEIEAYKARLAAGNAGKYVQNPMFVSVQEDGAARIMDEIERFLDENAANSAEELITSERHKLLIDRAVEAAERAEESARARKPLDLISYDVWESARFLGGITGEDVTEDVIDTIFSKFCLGK